MRRLLLLAALAALPALADEAPKRAVPATGEYSAKFAPLDELMMTFVEKANYPGGALAVAKDGKVAYARGFGVADRETKKPVPPDALFRISSVSKPLTAAAVFQLIERGKLRLDDKVMDVLDLKAPLRNFDERWRKVTIRNLLEHRAGWDAAKSKREPMFSSLEVVREAGGLHPAMPPAIIRYMLQQPLDFEPGEGYAYCNFGYCLLGRVIEKLSKQSYEGYVKKNVLAPLGIKQMRLGKTLVRAPGEVRYYSSFKAIAVMGPHFGKPVYAPYGGFCLEALDANGGWLASAPELLRFTLAFADPKTCRILKPETVEEMFARPKGVDAKQTRWHAKGWFVELVDGKRIHFHDGAMEGTAAMVVSRPDGIAFAVLLNSKEKVGGKEPIEVLNLPLHRVAGHLLNGK